jgi:hypothetical protein
MAEYRVSRTPASRGKQIDHLRIRSTSEGVTVEHHFKEDGLAYYEPKSYEFSKEETSDLVQHLGKYAGLPVHQTPDEGGDV